MGSSLGHIWQKLQTQRLLAGCVSSRISDRSDIYIQVYRKDIRKYSCKFLSKCVMYQYVNVLMGYIRKNIFFSELYFRKFCWCKNPWLQRKCTVQRCTRYWSIEIWKSDIFRWVIHNHTGWVPLWYLCYTEGDILLTWLGSAFPLKVLVIFLKN